MNNLKTIIASVGVVMFQVQIAFAETTLPNPTGLQNIQQFIAAFLKAVVQLSLPVIAFFMVYAGFKFVLARGSQDAITKAKDNLLYVVIGATLILGAWVLASLIGNTVNQIVG